MKKLLVKVNGKEYEVEVEIIEDDDQPTMPLPFQMPENRAAHQAQESVAFAPPQRMPRAGSPVTRAAGKVLSSPINGTVLEIYAKPDAYLPEKAPVLAIEAMKMKTTIYSTFAGTVKSIGVTVGEKVEQGHALITYE
jgi:biotin carboxyl carrier protein